jgi:hypothetical protein
MAERLDPLLDELFPAEQARIVQLLVQRIDLKARRARAATADARAWARCARTQLDRRWDAEGCLMPAHDPAVVTVKVPFAVRKRGGRKLVLAPDGAPVPPMAPQVDSTLVKAIARAFRWRKMLETSRYATIKEIAKAEKINSSYVSRVLRVDAAGAGHGAGHR